MSKTTLASVDGFTPIIDAVILEVGLIAAAVFGKVWRFCQMDDGVCKASQERIADELGLSRATVNTHINKLVEAGYLVDKTPTLAGVPHIYADSGKAGLSISLTGSQPNPQPPVKNFDTTCQNSLQPPVKNFDTTCQNSLQPPVKNFDTKKAFKKQEDTKKTIESADAPNFREMTQIECMAIPEIQTFRDATGWIPGTFVMGVVYDAIRSGLDPVKLQEAFTEWCARGYKPANVKGYLEWARDGIPPDRRKVEANSNYPRKQTLSDAQKEMGEWLTEQEVINVVSAGTG